LLLKLNTKTHNIQSESSGPIRKDKVFCMDYRRAM